MTDIFVVEKIGSREGAKDAETDKNKIVRFDKIQRGGHAVLCPPYES